MRRILFTALALVSLCLVSNAQVTLTSFATGFTAPVDIKNCGDDRLFIVEQNGRIQIVDTNGVEAPIPFLTITDRVKYGGEQGLLGLAFPSDFLDSGYFYVDYTSQPSGATRISRFRYIAGDDSVNRATEEILLTIYQPYTNHNGGHVAFGPDGYLYIGMGDGGSGGDPGARAQNPDSLLGKMLRIAVQSGVPGYSIPPTNVFANDASAGRPEIYTLGMRNPWRWSFDRYTGDLWIADVGQNVYEEIDFQAAGIPSGRNYGWRCYEGNVAYNTAGCAAANTFTYPIYTYQHTGGACSITGGYVYRGAKYAGLYGKYFFTDYCVSNIQAITKSGNTFTNTNYGALGGAASIVAFGEDRWGELYCSSITSGVVYKFGSTNCAPVAAINGGISDTVVDCGTGSKVLSVPYNPSSSYSWTFNGASAGPDSSSITATQEGYYVVTVSNNNCTNTDSVFVDQITPLTITVNNLDTVYCIYNSRVNLLPNFPGGVFAGDGIVGVAFDPAIAGVGVHTITYTYTAPNGCSYVFSQDVRIDLCLGLDRPAFTELQLFPSPAHEKFTVRGNFTEGAKVALQIMDNVGKVVMAKDFTVNGNEINVEQQLPGGIYFVKLSSNNTQSTLKLIVQ